MQPNGRQVDDLAAKITRYNPSADVALVREAFAVAEAAHEGQKRKSGDPYIVHPMAVASIVADMRLDVASVCSGLLHDTVEDTDLTGADLAGRFSPEIAFLVEGVTKLGKLPTATREERQAENFRKMLLAMAEDLRVILIKLADRLDNMRTLRWMSEESRPRIARETMDIYAPLAHRLGIDWLRVELEDLSFRWLYPAEYQKLVEDLGASEKRRRRYVQEVERDLRKMMAEHGIDGEVHGRSKNLWSIFSKMRKTGRPLGEIHDVVAFRIITNSDADCYAALGFVHQRYMPVPGRIKDYVAMPKPNRYQSLHTTVMGPQGERMEVQIRTREMHRVSEEGIIAHWIYKGDRSVISPDDRRKFSWLRQLVDFQQELQDPDEFMDAVKIDLFLDEVYVFTPRGDVKAFPAGATPVDFAYAVHTEVGHHCTGARVNGMMVPLRHKLKNGDTVEIITSPGQKPNKDWLKFVVTARARSKIRHHIRAEQRRQSRVIGRDLLERELRKRGLSLNKLLRAKEIARAARELRTGETEADLFLTLGYGKVTPAQVVRVLLPDEEPPARGGNGEHTPRLLQQVLARVTGRSASGILVQGEGDVLVQFARCCTALPGDPIVGYISRGRGVIVHKRDCKRVLDLDPERRVDVDWASGSTAEYPVTLRVHSSDQPGILAQIGNAFSDLGVNIMSANCGALENARAQNTFVFQVGNLKRLKEIMRAIQRVKGVYSVERV